MLNKNEILASIKVAAQKKILTKKELDLAFEAGMNDSLIYEAKKWSMIDILYYLGGGIIFLGIVIFLWQSWSLLNFTTKILATLGSGIAAYFLGVVLSQDKRTASNSGAFYLISALVLPIGFGILVEDAGFNPTSSSSQSLVSGSLLVMYLVSYSIFRKNIFILFCVFFGTFFFFSFTNFLIESTTFINHWLFSKYRILGTGLTYILLGYVFSKGSPLPLTGFLYNVGVLFFLGAALSLGGWEPNQNIFWELMFPSLVFGTLCLSVKFKSKSFLTWGTFFLMMYILKITSEYFPDRLGWPLVLIITGFFIMIVGYFFLSVKKIT